MRPRTITSAPERVVASKTSILWLIGCLALAAAVVPLGMRRPPWIEAEFALLAWWVVWIVFATRALHLGPIAERVRRPSQSEGKDRSQWWRAAEVLGWIDGWFALLAVLMLPVIWFLAEIAIPLLAVVLYSAVRGLLSHVAKDRHDCRERLGRSLLWATLWSTAYVAPLAILVGVLHWVLHR